MADVEHGILTPTQGSGIHTAIGWPPFATDADRLLQGVANADVGKLALVVDTQKIYVLTAALPTPKWFEACTVDELEAALDVKADDSDITALALEIATKADAAAVTAALGTKADAAATSTALAGKVDDAEFATLSNTVALKADKTYVDTQIDGRASDAELSALDARVVTLETQGPGAGNVTGPAASLDNQLARFSGTTGKTIKAGSNAPTYDDGGNLVMAPGAFVDGVDVSVLGATVSAQGTTLAAKVTGPAAANDNAIARYDGATGKIVQDSPTTVDDAGSIALPPSATVDGVDVSVLGSTVTSLSATVSGHTTQLASTVAGPAGASTDNAVMRWDGAGARTSQNSQVTIDDAGNISLPAGATVDGVDVSALAVSGGAPAAAQYVTLAFDAALTQERMLQVSNGVKATDGGAGAFLRLEQISTIIGSATAYNFATTDAGNWVYSTAPGAVTLTLISGTLPAGSTVRVLQAGNGQVTIAGSGVNLYSTAGASTSVKISEKWGVVSLYQANATDVWVYGNIENGATAAPYLTLAATASLPNERILTKGPGIDFTDAGPGGALTVAARLPWIMRNAGNYTLGVADAWTVQSVYGAAPVTVTVPTHATAAIPVETEIHFDCGNYQVTFAAETGVSAIYTPPGRAAKMIGLHSRARLYKMSANLWILDGDLEDATSYLTLAATASHPNERILTQGPGIAITDGGAGGAVTVAQNYPQTSTNATAYTLVLADAFTIKGFGGNPTVVTIPTNASVPFPIGTMVGLRCVYGYGANSGLSVVAPGVTMNVPQGRLAVANGSSTFIWLYKTGTDAWEVKGDLAGVGGNPFKARAAGSGQSIPSSARTVLALGASFDPNANFSGNAYTAPVSGYYWVSLYLRFATISAGAVCLTNLTKNGAIAQEAYMSADTSGAGASIGWNNALLQLTAGDVLRAEAYQTGAAAATTHTTMLCLHMLST